MRTEKVITILADKKKRFGERKGPVRSSSVKRPLARRRVGVFVRYFETGVLADGTDVGFYVQPSPTSATFNIGGSPFTGNPYHIVTASSTGIIEHSGDKVGISFGGVDYAAAWNAHILTIDVDDWADTYREIDGDLEPEYALSSANPVDYVQGRGFRVANEAVGGPLAITSNLLIHGFSTTGTGSGESPPQLGTYPATKITNTAVYADPSVAFALDASCDVFLMPTIVFWWGFAAQADGDGDPSTYTPDHQFVDFEAWFLNSIYSSVPRSIAIGVSEWDEIFNAAYGSGSFKENLPSGVRAWWRSAAVNAPGARMYFFDPPGAGSLADLSSVSPTLFPTEDGTLSNESPENSYIPYVAMTRFFIPEGTLLAVIKKRGVYFYIWSSEDLVLNNNNRHYGGFV